MQNYKVGNEVHVLDSVEFEHMLPKGWVKITQAQADILSAPIPETPAQADIRKDAQIAAEFTPAMEALERARDPVNATTIINQAKAARRDQL